MGEGVILWRIIQDYIKDYDNIWSVATISCLLWKLDYKNETNLICGAILTLDELILKLVNIKSNFISLRSD